VSEDVEPQSVETGEFSPTQDLTDALMNLIRLSRSFADSEMIRLNHVQYSLLACLNKREESTLTTICEDLGYDLSVLSRQVGNLADQGLVVRAKDPHDGRAWRISLTDLGRQRFTHARDKRTALLTTALAPYCDSDRETAARILTALNNVLSETLHRKGIPLG